MSLVPSAPNEAAFASGFQPRRAWNMLWIDFIQHIPDADPPEAAAVARVVLEPGQLDGLIERLTAVREKSSLPPPPGSKGKYA